VPAKGSHLIESGGSLLAKEAPQRAESACELLFTTGAKQETGILQAANPPDNNPESETHNLKAVLLRILQRIVVASAGVPRQPAASR